MKKIIGLIFSPRKFGNCETVLKEVSRNIPEPHTLQLLRLSDFDIKQCKGCYQCLFKEEKCILKDDLYKILDAIGKSDALMISVPTYFLGANAALKLLLDRGLSFYSYADKIWHKPAIGIGLAGIQGKEGYTMLCIESFLKIIHSKIQKIQLFYGALPGEVFLNDENKKRAAAIGKTFLGSAPLKKPQSCPLCGGDTFRFLGKNVIKCMLCSNSGKINFENGTPVFHMKEEGHDFFFSPEESFNHREWLKGMKDRFIEKKKALKNISSNYLRDGEWIKP